MPLLTRDDVEEWVPQASGNETRITAAIARAEALAAQYCGRTAFLSASFDEFYSAQPGQRVIQLLNYPVTAYSSITEQAQETTPTTLTAASDYDSDDVGGMLWRRGAPWAQGFKQVRVQYTAGYSTSTLPEDLKHGMLELVGWILDRRGDRGIAANSVDGASETREKLVRGVPESIAGYLRDYQTLVTV